MAESEHNQVPGVLSVTTLQQVPRPRKSSRPAISSKQSSAGLRQQLLRSLAKAKFQQRGIQGCLVETWGAWVFVIIRSHVHMFTCSYVQPGHAEGHNSQVGNFAARRHSVSAQSQQTCCWYWESSTGFLEGSRAGRLSTLKTLTKQHPLSTQKRSCSHQVAMHCWHIAVDQTAIP